MINAQHAYSAQAVVGWNADSGSVAGYKVSYGQASGNYTSSADAGTATSYTIPSLAGPTGYITVQAYNSSNVYSAYAPELVVEQITASAGSGGSISPTGTFFKAYNESQAFTITPSTGYTVSSVLVDGVSVGAVTSYTLSNIEASHTVSATFAAQTATTYNITASCGSNGTISPSGTVTVNSQANQTFTITPTSGYTVSSVMVDGTSAGAVTTYTFTNVTQSHTISATFVAGDPLVADAGPDQTVSSGATVTLNGSNSSDAGGPGIASYLWTQTGGQHMKLANPNSATTTFRARVWSAQALTFQLTVTDANGATATDTCIVNVTNSGDTAPSVSAGSNQTVSESTIVTLSGSESTGTSSTGSSSAEPSATGASATDLSSADSYLWQQVDGPAVNLSNANSPQATFVAPEAASGAASLSFQLTVTNSEGLKSRAKCIVNVTQAESPPKASTGPAGTANAGAAVQLAGSGSTASNDAVASLRWHQLSGAPVTLSDPTSATPTFTANARGKSTPLIFSLTVKDENGLRSSATQVITVK